MLPATPFKKSPTIPLRVRKRIEQTVQTKDFTIEEWKTVVIILAEATQWATFTRLNPKGKSESAPTEVRNAIKNCQLRLTELEKGMKALKAREKSPQGVEKYQRDVKEIVATTSGQSAPELLLKTCQENRRIKAQRDGILDPNDRQRDRDAIRDLIGRLEALLLHEQGHATTQHPVPVYSDEESDEESPTTPLRDSRPLNLPKAPRRVKINQPARDMAPECSQNSGWVRVSSDERSTPLSSFGVSRSPRRLWKQKPKLSVKSSIRGRFSRQGRIVSEAKSPEKSRGKSNVTWKSLAGQIYVQTDPNMQLNPVHVKIGDIMKCLRLEQDQQIPKFCLQSCKSAPGELPPWKSTEADEDRLDQISDKLAWARQLAEQRRRRQLPKAQRDLENEIRRDKWQCGDNTRVQCPLLIEGVCVEDVLLDTGSMFNAISLKALWAMVGRFDLWARAFETSIDWCAGEMKLQAAGGGIIPILAVIRLHVQISAGRHVPIYWAVYEDTDFSILLGTSGMKQLGLTLKSQHLGDENLIIPKDKAGEVASRVFRHVISPPPLSSYATTMVSKEQKQIDRDIESLLDGISFDPSVGRLNHQGMNALKPAEEEPSTSAEAPHFLLGRPADEGEEEDFCDSWELNRAPSYDQ